MEIRKRCSYLHLEGKRGKNLRYFKCNCASETCFSAETSGLAVKRCWFTLVQLDIWPSLQVHLVLKCKSDALCGLIPAITVGFCAWLRWRPRMFRGQLSSQPTTVAPPITTVQNHPSERWVEGVGSTPPHTLTWILSCFINVQLVFFLLFFF